MNSGLREQALTLYLSVIEPFFSLPVRTEELAKAKVSPGHGIFQSIRCLPLPSCDHCLLDLQSKSGRRRKRSEAKSDEGSDEGDAEPAASKGRGAHRGGSKASSPEPGDGQDTGADTGLDEGRTAEVRRNWLTRNRSWCGLRSGSYLQYLNRNHPCPRPLRVISSVLRMPARTCTLGVATLLASRWFHAPMRLSRPRSSVGAPAYF